MRVTKTQHVGLALGWVGYVYGHMPLSRREIRTRATRFAKQWAAAHNEDADAKPFWYVFFQ